MEIENTLIEIKNNFEALERIRISQRLANKKYFQLHKDKINQRRKEKKVELSDEQNENRKQKNKDRIKQRYHTDLEFKKNKIEKVKEYQRLKKEEKIEVFEN